MALPSGVTLAAWALERVRIQNPRIRAFLGCIRHLEAVLDSNYAILHCSPRRLEQAWKQVSDVARLIHTDLAPALEAKSQVPELEQARQKATIALEMVSKTVLREIEKRPITLREEDLPDVRKLLCVSLGELNGFLQETFCQVVAADPRSQQNADYFMSRRFPRDVEEAEWLHASVGRLLTYLQGLGRDRPRQLSSFAARIRDEESIPAGQPWEEVVGFLDELIGGLTPLLKSILALRGIRFDEMEILDRYAYSIPSKANMLLEFFRSSVEIGDRIVADARTAKTSFEPSVWELTVSHAVLATRIADLLTELGDTLGDLTTFAPLWLESIEMRRALLFRRSQQPQLETP